MRSPILQLESAIAGAPFRIAPEREKELGDWCDEEGVFLDIVDQPGFTFHVYPSEKKVQTSIASLEFLWSTAMFIWFYMMNTLKLRREGSKRLIQGALKGPLKL